MKRLRTLGLGEANEGIVIEGDGCAKCVHGLVSTEGLRVTARAAASEELRRNGRTANVTARARLRVCTTCAAAICYRGAGTHSLCDNDVVDVPALVAV